MKAEIEKLIKLAAEGGSFSDRQREIILRKAQEAGEDLDEVQFMMKIAAREAKSFPNQKENEVNHALTEELGKPYESAPSMELKQEQMPQVINNTADDKNMFIAAILAFTLGWIGAHKFYLGKMKSGMLYLIFFWTFIPFFISIVEGFGYLFEAMGIKNK